MEPNQTNPSPDNSGIPQGIPTGVFVPNNQQPVQNTAQPSVVAPAQTAAPATAVQSGPAKEGALDKIFKGLAKFFAKVMGQPDPITGAPNTSEAAKKTENIVGKVWNVANQAVAKATEAATKAANTVNQATEKIQQVIPQQAAPTSPSAVADKPVVEQQPTPPAQPIPPAQPTV